MDPGHTDGLTADATRVKSKPLGALSDVREARFALTFGAGRSNAGADPARDALGCRFEFDASRLERWLSEEDAAAVFASRLAAFPEDAVAFLIERACERHALWCPERWTVSYANRGYFGLEGRFGMVYIEGPGAQRRYGVPAPTPALFGADPVAPSTWPVLDARKLALALSEVARRAQTLYEQPPAPETGIGVAFFAS